MVAGPPRAKAIHKGGLLMVFSSQSYPATRTIPQAELQRIADAGVDLVALSRRLVELNQRITQVAPPLGEALEREISLLLDLADAVSSAARASTYLK